MVLKCGDFLGCNMMNSAQRARPLPDASILRKQVTNEGPVEIDDAAAVKKQRLAR